jgi:hypothetical protein
LIFDELFSGRKPECRRQPLRKGKLTILFFVNVKIFRQNFNIGFADFKSGLRHKKSNFGGSCWLSGAG